MEARLHAQVEAIEALAHPAQGPERPEAMTQVKKQLPAVAALVDFWWQGVRWDLEHAAVSPLWQQWAQEGLVPWRYWTHQVPRTRCTRRKAKMQQVLERVRAALRTHMITRCLPAQALKAWQAWATPASLRFSPRLFSRRRSQRLSGGDASPAAGLTPSALQGVERPP